VGLAAAAVTVAEVGRRRDGGAAVFPATAALWAPLWLVERGLCSWLALVARLRGGVRYGGSRLARAATPRREPARRHGGALSAASSRRGAASAQQAAAASAQQVEAGQDREGEHELLEA